MSINTYCDSTFQGSNVTINGTSSNTVSALKVTESGDSLFEVGPTNSIAFRLGDIDGLGDETFIEGGYSDIKFKANSNTTAIFDGNNRVTINSSTAGAYQLGVNGSIGTTSSIAWLSSGVGSSPSYTADINSSGYLEIDEVTSGGGLSIKTDNTIIGSGQVYLEGGLTSATPSQYLGRVTGGGNGVLVGRTAAQVLADIGAGSMSNWNLTADTGGSFSVGQGTTVDIAGGTNISTTRTGATVQINNGITNNNQLTNGAGYTTNTGTVTGTGTSGQLAIFSGSSSVTSNAGLAEVSTGVLFVNSQVQVKGVNDADFTCSSDTDTGLGSFDGSNGVSLVSKGKKMITVKEGDIAFNEMTATAVSTTGPLSANQSNQAPTQDTLATLAVDPSGNVVRGEQEATFKFTLAQLNSTLGQTLISAPGADKAVVITYTDWMMEYSSTGSVNNQLEIRQANLAQANASVSVLPALRFNEIVNQSQSGSAPFYGFYTRDIPTGSGSQGRTYAVNKATTFHKQTSSPYPSGLTSISIKIRYRVFDVDTF